jgi:hypothetical protein
VVLAPERLGGSCTGPAHPADRAVGVIAKFLRHAFGAATRAEGADDLSDGLPDLELAGLLTALQRRDEQGIGPDGTAGKLMYRCPHRQPPR